MSNYMKRLVEKKEKILNVQKIVFLKKSMYPLDLLFCGAVDRSLALIDGFISLNNTQNYLCMAPIVRMHLDTVLRIFATTLVEDPNKLAEMIFEGNEIRKIPDKDGKKMSDAYLRKGFIQFWNELDANVSWVDPVYKKTSGHIHLSRVHILSSVSECGNDGNIEFRLNGQVKEYDMLAREAAAAMCEISDILAFYINNWAEQK